MLDQAVPGTCDTLIVGAGLAGTELAGELEGRGVGDVAVLEAGPGHDLLHSNLRYDADEALRRWLEPSSDLHFDRSWTSLSPPHYTGSSGLRRRVGGRSLYWYGVMLPAEDWALRPPWWPEPVIRDLTCGWRGGQGLYDRLISRLSAWRSPGAAESRVPAVALAGLQLRQAPRAVRHADGDPTRWYAYSPLDRWRDPETGEVTRRPTGVSLSAETEVVSVMVRDGAVQGVVARRTGDPGSTREIRARRVILAAGTMGSARLAIQALRDAESETAPRLGGLCDHMVQGVFVRLDESAGRRLLAHLPADTYYAPCGEAARSNLFLEVQLLDGANVLVDLQLTGEQLPSPENYVECDDSGRRPWPMSVRSTPTSRDREVLREQRLVLQAALNDLLGLIGKVAPALTFDSFDAPARTNSIVRTQRLRRGGGEAATWSGFLGTEDHEGGTLPLGGPLDLEGRFKAIEGLYAVGPQTFPRIGAANVALTALALSHRLAATLASSPREPSGARP